MIDELSILCLLIALGGALAARGFLHAGLSHAAQRWPGWAAALDKGAGGVRLSVERSSGAARRKMIMAMLSGRMPDGPARDPAMQAIARRLKLSLGAVALGVLAVVLLARLSG